MKKTIHLPSFPRGITWKLLAGLFFVLALWTVLLSAGGLGVVRHIGDLAAGESEAGVRRQAVTMFSSLVEEKARRQDEIFRQAVEHTQLLARMAGAYLQREDIYGKGDVLRSAGVVPCPANGLYSNAADELTNIVYCCKDKLPDAFATYNNVYSHLDPLLEKIQQGNSVYLAIWAAYEFAWHSGFVHYYPNIHYIESIPRPEVSTSWESAYYQVVRPENNPHRETRWTKALNDDTGVGLIVSVISPVPTQSSHGFTAVAADISLKTLVDDIQGFRFHPSPAVGPSNAFAFLVDGDGSVIAFPEKHLASFGLASIAGANPGSGKALGLNLGDSSLPGMADLVRAMISQDKGDAKLLVGGDTYDLFFHRIATTGWTYCIAIPGSELFTAADKTRGAITVAMSRLTAWFGYAAVAFLSLTLPLAWYYLRRKMVAPLRFLVGAMRRVSSGDLTPQVEARPTQDEMADLACSFNAMTTSLRARQDALRLAETKYRGIFENAVEGMFQCAAEGTLLAANPAFAAQLGCASPEEAVSVLGDFLTTCCVDPGDRETFHRMLARDGLVVGFETRLQRRDGTLIWGAVSARSVREAGGAQVLDGSLQDVTSAKRAQEQADALNCSLLEAQEEKRADMSRDLHDELAQNLSSLKIDSDHLAQDAPDESRMRERMQEFVRKLNRTVDSICELVYDLYPSELESKGLSEAMQRLVHDFTTEYGIAARFEASPGLALAELSDMDRIMLFRIAQEALRNVLRHARASTAWVGLEILDSRLLLRVADDGQGFEPEDASRNALQGRRMGLIGMRERARILGGELYVASAPGQGAEILVSVSLAAKGEQEPSRQRQARPL